MSFTIHDEQVPLRIDDSGAVRVGSSRVLLDIVINAYRMGDSVEEIVNHYPTLNVADVYSVLGYYLRHRAEVDAYLRQNEQDAETLRRNIEQRQGSQAGLREKLLARRLQLKSETIRHVDVAYR